MTGKPNYTTAWLVPTHFGAEIRVNGVAGPTSSQSRPLRLYDAGFLLFMEPRRSRSGGATPVNSMSPKSGALPVQDPKCTKASSYLLSGQGKRSVQYGSASNDIDISPWLIKPFATSTWKSSGECTFLVICLVARTSWSRKPKETGCWHLFFAFLLLLSFPSLSPPASRPSLEQPSRSSQN